MFSRTFSLTLALATFLGCSGPDALRPADGQGAEKNISRSGPTMPHDPNEIVVQTDGGSPALDGSAPVSQLSARTTLLEDNEHLRDMLAKALAERRDTEQRLSEATLRCEAFETEVTQLRESVAQLSEQIDQQTTKIGELERTKSKLEKDRSTLAEMYALEKRQRLAFEKELLEREIRNRTLSKDG